VGRIRCRHAEYRKHRALIIGSQVKEAGLKTSASSMVCQDQAINKEAGLTMEDTVSKAQVSLWTALGLMFAVGMIGAFSADHLQFQWLQPPARELSAALITTACLGFTVDRVLKIEIARDVFAPPFVMCSLTN
jgi:hypothetical protein